MPEGFNWLDIIIGIFLIISLIQGLRAGLIKSVFTIAGIAAGLIIAAGYYVEGSSLLLSYIELPQFLADTVSFITIFSVTFTLIHLAGSLFSVITRFSLIRVVDRIGGSLTGLLIGLAVIGVILIMLTAFPIFDGFQDYIEESYLAPPLIESTEIIYDDLSDLLSIDLPRLAFYPEELNNYFSSLETLDHPGEHHNVNFRELDGSTCFVCDAPVEFIGFLDNQVESTSPKFVCTECGRTSDGCQTFEGYHEMYDQCPVKLGNQGYRFDCGIWTNHSYHRPTGPCPVCGIE